MTAVSAVFGGPAHRRATVVIGLALLLVAVTLLTIGANSPYTHANLNGTYDDRYVRTEQITVGPPQPFDGFPRRASAVGAVPDGKVLFITAGCVGCHALDGQGGAVAKPIAGVDETLLTQRIRGGTAGMPAFSNTALTDAEIAAISAYLRSLPPVPSPAP